MAVVTKRLFTIGEYQGMGESGILGEDDRLELIEGEIVEMSSIGRHHAGQVAQVDEVLQRVVAGRAVLWVQHPVDLDEYSEPQPDVTLLRARTGH